MSDSPDKEDTVAAAEPHKSSTADLSLDNPLSMLSKKFTLVSCEGKEINMPVYDLMGWSTFFRDLLQSGSGKLRIELEERAETIEQFKQLIDTRAVKWQESSVPFFTQVFDLTDFLDKYDCPRALDQLLDLLRQGVQGVRDGDPPHLPPLILFAVGARLARPELCGSALDVSRSCWLAYSRWTRPPEIGEEQEQHNTLHPLGIPYQILSEMPFNYAVVLSLTGVEQNLPYPKKDEKQKGYMFMRVLDKLTERAEQNENVANV